MSHSESSDTPQIHGTAPVKDTSKPGWIARTIFGTIGLAAESASLAMSSTRTTIAGIGLILVAGFHFVAASQPDGTVRQVLRVPPRPHYTSYQSPRPVQLKSRD